MNVKKPKNQRNKKDKLPFAVFVTPKTKTKNEEVSDYKQVFTDIISDRIKEKYR